MQDVYYIKFHFNPGDVVKNAWVEVELMWFIGLVLAPLSRDEFNPELGIEEKALPSQKHKRIYFFFIDGDGSKA